MAAEGGGMQVVESRFQLQDQKVWFGKAKLLADRIILKGLGFHRRIQLADIVEVRWAADELVLVLQNGEEVDMIIKAAALWKYELQARCKLKDAPTSPELLKSLPHSTGNELGGDDGQSVHRAAGTSSAAAGVRAPSDSALPAAPSDSAPHADSEPHAAEENGHESPLLFSGDGLNSNAEMDETLGEQTDMFLEKESTYRIRSGFAGDRPQHPKRADDVDE